MARSFLGRNAISLVLSHDLTLLHDAWSDVRQFGLGWIGSHARSPRASTATATVAPSWQDVHRQDTASLLRRRAELRIASRHPTTTSSSQLPLTAMELGWARRNFALVHLLRTGEWQSVPSAPPDAWIERLAGDFPEITAGEARRIFVTACEAVLQPRKAAVPQPWSPDEREWLGQNRAIVRDHHNGQLRGIPTKPSRSWIATFQAAVGGTGAEIAAILAILLKVIEQTHTAVAATG